MLDLHALLQRGETCDSVRKRDDFSVRNKRFGLLLRECRDELGIGPIQQLVIARIQAHLRSVPEARHRSPSSFGSNSQPFREKAWSLSVASMGSIHSGCLVLRSFARSPGGKVSSASSAVIRFVFATSIPEATEPP